MVDCYREQIGWSMGDAWMSAALPLAVAVALSTLPGLAVVVAGWGVRRIGVLFAAPAVSIAILAVSATVAPFVGVGWSLLPVAVVTVVVAAVAWLVGRWAGRSAPRPSRAAVFSAIGGFAVAAVVIGTQLARVIGSPEHISQTFDAIVHLNTVKFAVETANASPFHIGATSDVPFYPNGWHALTSLVVQLGGADVPTAVSAVSIAVAAVAWPASSLALATAFFAQRPAAYLVTAALTTGFGAFPVLLFSFGVLYPNALAYSILPAGLAAVWWLLRSRRPADRVRSAALLVLILAGIGLSHPNAVLALYAFSAAILFVQLLLQAAGARSGRIWLRNTLFVLAILVVGILLWRYSRTGYAMSRWGPWGDLWNAIVDAVMVAPRGFTPTLIALPLVIIGLVAAAWRGRRLYVAMPFVAATFMFVLVSGTPVETYLRELVANPWYNDSHRIAALIPITAIPVMTLGALAVVRLARRGAARLGIRRPVAQIALTVAGALMFLVAAGPNVNEEIALDSDAYRADSDAYLLSAEERALLDRLDETTPADALIAGNPWTGAALAYAIGDREVVEKHVFGTRSPDATYLDLHLRDIDTDPAVCEALDELGIDYVLDFGPKPVFQSADAASRSGMNDLVASERLVLVDEEGDSARLFRVECR